MTTPIFGSVEWMLQQAPPEYKKGIIWPTPTVSAPQNPVQAPQQPDQVPSETLTEAELRRLLAIAVQSGRITQATADIHLRQFLANPVGYERESTLTVFDPENVSGLRMVQPAPFQGRAAPTLPVPVPQRPWDIGEFPGLQAAFTGEVVPPARLLPSLGAPSFPSPQGLRRLVPSEREMFRAEVETGGFNWPDYAEQMQRMTVPTWAKRPKVTSMMGWR